MEYKIVIELYPANGQIFHYDSFKDGPIGEWLASVGARLGKELNSLSHNATIAVYEYKP